MKKLKHVFILAVLLPMIAFSQNNTNMNTALLIVDIQEFYFVDGRSQLVEPEAASDQAAILLDASRKNEDVIVHIRHASENNAAIHENVKPAKNEKVITKHFVNSFKETDLLEFLQKNNVDRVVICGMMTHMCVEAAARASSDFGFEVFVIDDACATRDVTFGENTVKADDMHTSALGTIEGYYGKVMSVEEYLKE